MRAAYEVNFNGFNVGTFEFEAQTEEQELLADRQRPADPAAWAFTWIGETRTFGLISNQTPKPAAFSFDFKANSKTGSTKMDFANGDVPR